MNLDSPSGPNIDIGLVQKCLIFRLKKGLSIHPMICFSYIFCQPHCLCINAWANGQYCKSPLVMIRYPRQSFKTNQNDGIHSITTEFMSDTLCPKNFIKRDLNIFIRKKQSNETKSNITQRCFVLKIFDGDCIKPQMSTILLTS